MLDSKEKDEGESPAPEADMFQPGFGVLLKFFVQNVALPTFDIVMDIINGARLIGQVKACVASLIGSFLLTALHSFSWKSYYWQPGGLLAHC